MTSGARHDETIQIRPFQDGDYPSLVALRNAIATNGSVTVDGQRNFDVGLQRHGSKPTRLLAEIEREVVGYADIFGVGEAQTVDIGVSPRMRRRGIGSAMWAGLAEMLFAREPRVVRTYWIDAANQGSLAFLIFHDFQVRERAWNQTLDLATFDPSGHANPTTRLAEQGISITSLAAEGTEDYRALRDIYALHNACRSDQPPFEDHRDSIPFEFWLARMIQDPDALLDAFFLAKARDEYVGMSLLQQTRDPGIVESGFTGVLPAYRNRGIARSLKLQAIAYARTHGYRAISTGNHAANGPMLRVNESLGFRKVGERVRFEKKV